jgi:purine-cytosine permease-like protein
MSIAVVLGCVLGTFFMAFHSTQGPQLGLPQMIQSRPQFGYLGALLVWAVALVTFVGFNAFNEVLAAAYVEDHLRHAFSLDDPDHRLSGGGDCDHRLHLDPRYAAPAGLRH